MMWVLVTATQTLILFLMILVCFILAIVLPWKKKASATAVISTSLILIFIALFLMVNNPFTDIPVIQGISVQKLIVLRELGFYPPAIIDEYKVYQFITSTFLHFDFMHLMFNFAGLFILGTQLEQRVGWQRFLVIYFGTAVAANAVILVISPFDILGHSMNQAGIGASGGIFGILGALWYLYPREEIFFPLLILRKWPISLIVLIYGGITALFILLGTDDNVSHVAHFVGLVSSFPIAFLVRVRNEDKVEELKPISKEELEGMARTKGQKRSLERAITSDEKDVRDAWLEDFFSRINCPKCDGRGMNYDGKDSTCPKCGKRIRP